MGEKLQQEKLQQEKLQQEKLQQEKLQKQKLEREKLLQQQKLQQLQQQQLQQQKEQQPQKRVVVKVKTAEVAALEPQLFLPPEGVQRRQKLSERAATLRIEGGAAAAARAPAQTTTPVAPKSVMEGSWRKPTGNTKQVLKMAAINEKRKAI